ncbi:hypothetical protein TanjilG_22840 [Lupinus angustifolius]|uniref:Uncharacterized protein n=1 Tax=Lupinus angustifolius TaxID=3871 RepID=A0A4P1RI85_LUPAN|nr:hypothetical protein TanjilG_22840 [Lupinus angustifolius]
MTALKLSNYPRALEYLDVPTNKVDGDDFKEEQNSVARLIQKLYNDDPKEFFKTIETLGGAPVPELALPLYLQCAEDSRAQMTALHLIIGTLQRMHVFIVENRDTLTHKATEAANDSDLEPVAYEFFTQAYILYEEKIWDSRAQMTALHLIIGTLQRMHVFIVENRDTLTHKATEYSAKHLKNLDQCRAVYACSHLF